MIFRYTELPSLSLLFFKIIKNRIHNNRKYFPSCIQSYSIKYAHSSYFFFISSLLGFCAGVFGAMINTPGDTIRTVVQKRVLGGLPGKKIICCKIIKNLFFLYMLMRINGRILKMKMK